MDTLAPATPIFPTNFSQVKWIISSRKFRPDDISSRKLYLKILIQKFHLENFVLKILSLRSWKVNLNEIFSCLDEEKTFNQSFFFIYIYIIYRASRQGTKDFIDILDLGTDFCNFS